MFNNLIKFWKTQISSLTILLGILIFFAPGCHPGQNCTDWVVKIDDETICKSQIDMEYNAIIETYAKMQGMETDKFIELINDDNMVKNQPMLLQLRKNNFISRYINEYLFYREALKDNIQDKDTVKAMLNYQKKSYISQYYLESSLKSDISVSDEAVEKFYNSNRTKIPSLRQLPISEAFKRVRLYLIEQKKQRVLQQRVQELRDKFKIEMNKTMDIGINDDNNDVKSDKDKKKPETKKASEK